MAQAERGVLAAAFGGWHAPIWVPPCPCVILHPRRYAAHQRRSPGASCVPAARFRGPGEAPPSARSWGFRGGAAPRRCRIIARSHSRHRCSAGLALLPLVALEGKQRRAGRALSSFASEDVHAIRPRAGEGCGVATHARGKAGGSTSRSQASSCQRE
eukprot:11794532-Alexandrium_andersonii.AAC.1